MENTELKRYYENGTLNIEQTRWQALDRLNAGERLQKVAYQAGKYIKAMDVTKIRVDISGYKATPESKSIAEDMYNKAIKEIPSEYFPIIRHVVIEDLKIQHKSQSDVRLDKWRLCLGLDYLCDFYYLCDLYAKKK